MCIWSSQHLNAWLEAAIKFNIGEKPASSQMSCDFRTFCCVVLANLDEAVWADKFRRRRKKSAREYFYFNTHFLSHTALPHLSMDHSIDSGKVRTSLHQMYWMLTCSLLVKNMWVVEIIIICHLPCKHWFIFKLIIRFCECHIQKQ